MIQFLWKQTYLSNSRQRFSKNSCELRWLLKKKDDNGWLDGNGDESLLLPLLVIAFICHPYVCLNAVSNVLNSEKRFYMLHLISCPSDNASLEDDGVATACADVTPLNNK